MTHKQLIEIGKYWLINAKGCNPVFTERGSQRLSEVPDVIGWTAKDCFIVECKISVSDFVADFKKDHRRSGGLGNHHYYLMEVDLYEKIKTKDWGDWGIAIANKNTMQARQLSACNIREKRNYEQEILYFRSRIMQIQNFGR